MSKFVLMFVNVYYLEKRKAKSEDDLLESERDSSKRKPHSKRVNSEKSCNTRRHSLSEKASLKSDSD